MLVNAFPSELLHHILDEFKPIYNINSVEDGAHKTQLYPKNWKPYAQTCSDFARLRLVCRRWDSFITPLLYSTYVLTTRPEEHLKRAVEGFKYNPHLIDRLIIRGHVGPRHTVQSGAAELLAACISGCTNLKQLEIIDPHRIFWHIGKSKAYAVFQSIPPSAPFQSLSLYFMHPKDHRGYAFGVHAALLGLGRRTRDLKDLRLIVIDHTETGQNVNSSESLYFPSEFTNLRTLSIQGGLEKDLQLPKLLSRIRRKGQDTSPLRELTLSRMRNFVDTEYMEMILSINNLGLHLTVLQLRLPPWSFYDPDPNHHVKHTHELPSTLLRCCPALETFIYLTHCPVKFLHALPHNLRTFGIRIEPRPTDSWLQALPLDLIHDSQPLVAFVRNERMRKDVKVLVIEWGNEFYIKSRSLGKKNSKPLREACAAYNVEYTEKIQF
ncbi:hypothetical protein BDN72DRAFT_144431 [Pluteus cervinus]|uniref:Uncharacterized protein n=1 Tax=Pluteus cervinus TaxID=181527 RepID=A0ACD3ALE0_9AGAR|nr:hypothetical protein BDN72DRAFT_144431 [Pluteus cervinus]